MTNNKKVGIFCPSIGENDSRERIKLIEKNIKELAKSNNNDYHFYLLINYISETNYNKFKLILNDNITIVPIFDNFKDMCSNYFNKIKFALDQNHLFSIKIDDDIFMSSKSWDEFIKLTIDLKQNDLFCTGVLSTNNATSDVYVKTFFSDYYSEFKKLCFETEFKTIAGTNYSELNLAKQEMNSEWDYQIFLNYVKKLNTPFKGIHPVRINFKINKFINDLILNNKNAAFDYKEKDIIRDSGQTGKIPYYTNNIFGIKTSEWKILLSQTHLYADCFDEVVLNRYRDITETNMVIHTGIPMLHTGYNWVCEAEYENQFIDLFTLD